MTNKHYFSFCQLPLINFWIVEGKFCGKSITWAHIVPFLSWRDQIFFDLFFVNVFKKRLITMDWYSIKKIFVQDDVANLEVEEKRMLWCNTSNYILVRTTKECNSILLVSYFILLLPTNNYLCLPFALPMRKVLQIIQCGTYAPLHLFFTCGLISVFAPHILNSKGEPSIL